MWNRCTVRPLGIYTATRSSPQTEIPVNIQYPHRIVVKEKQAMSNPSQPSAVLVAIHTPRVTGEELESSLHELTRLVKTLGYNVVGQVRQKRSSDKFATVLGKGKLAELALWTGGTGKVAASVERKTNKAALKREAAASDAHG